MDRFVQALAECDTAERLAVALNVAGREAAAALPAGGRIELSTAPERDGAAITERAKLAPHEGIIVRLGARD
jgi:hypothetical protein